MANQADIMADNPVTVNYFALPANVRTQVVVFDSSRRVLYFNTMHNKVRLSVSPLEDTPLAPIRMFGFDLPKAVGSPSFLNFTIGNDGPLVMMDWFAEAEDSTTLMVIEIKHNERDK